MDCFIYDCSYSISFISETSVFSILPNLEDEEIVESSAKQHQLGRSLLLLNFLKFSSNFIHK